MALDPKQFPTEVLTLRRSEIDLCDYNPRYITDEGRRLLRRSLRKYGVIGGIVINRRTGNRVMGGNQKVALLDDFNKYPENDYELRVEAMDVDETTEKEIVVILNNPNVGGDWDMERLRDIGMDINLRDVGFTNADLSIIGLDLNFRTDGEVELADTFDAMLEPVREQQRLEAEQRRAANQSADETEQGSDEAEQDPGEAEHDPGEDGYDLPPSQPRAMTPEEKIAHVKKVKSAVSDIASGRLQQMEAYFTVSFDDYEAKAAFLTEWGYDPSSRFIKGEDFAQRIDGLGEE